MIFFGCAAQKCYRKRALGATIPGRGWRLELQVNLTVSPRLRFEEFELDPQSCELFHGRSKLKIQDKPLSILLTLLQHPHQTITRAELYKIAWSDANVQRDLCLNTAVRKLRVVLGDSTAHPRFIETVGKHGYRFIGQ